MIGSAILNYKIIEKLGSGGIGVVYPDKNLNPETYGSHKVFIKEFLR